MKSHYQDTKLKAQKRINIIKGQLDGLYRMIEGEEYCINILNQSLAIQNSLKGLDAEVFDRHLKMHISPKLKGDESQTLLELVNLFKRINK